MSEAVKRFIWRAPIYEASTEMTDLYPDGIQYVLATDHDRIVAELRAQIERAVSATNAECNDWAREHVMRMQVMDERDALRAEVEALRKDAERYRFVRELAWYVDQAAFVYEVGNSRSPWSSERASVDADDIEEAIDSALGDIAAPEKAEQSVMSLDDAIEHALEVGKHECESSCGQNHRQLAEWLLELKSLWATSKANPTDVSVTTA